MKKYKISESQFSRLIESDTVKGGLDRVNSTFKKSISTTGVKLTEGVKNPELYSAIHDTLQGIWLNPEGKNYNPFFKREGISWDELVAYLQKKGIIASIDENTLKVKNYYKKNFSIDKTKSMIEKMSVIDDLTKEIIDDPEAPWAGIEQPSTEVEESNYPPGAETNPEAPYNQGSDKLDVSKAPKIFKPIAMGHEIAILNGPDGLYAFYFADIPRETLPNTKYELILQDLADYVNANVKSISKGSGLHDFERGADLVRIDEPLKNELMGLYSKDKHIIKALQGIHEMTSAAGGSSGAFTGPMNASPIKKIDELISDEEQIEGTPIEEDVIDEVTAGAPSAGNSNPTGSYVQPAIWAKNKKNWAPAHKTQYPKGEMVKIDSCTKLNNNKSAENGKCSTGAVDNVVKTHKTKQSVISKSAVYETIAKKTGRSVADVKKLIESKLNNGKSLA